MLSMMAAPLAQFVAGEWWQWSQLPGSDLAPTIDGTEVSLARGTGGIVATFYLRFVTIPGETYDVTGTVGTSAMSFRVGTGVNNGSLVSENVNAGALSESFTAASGVTYISLWPVSTSATSTLDDFDISIQ